MQGRDDSSGSSTREGWKERGTRKRGCGGEKERKGERAPLSNLYTRSQTSHVSWRCMFVCLCPSVSCRLPFDMKGTVYVCSCASSSFCFQSLFVRFLSFPSLDGRPEPRPINVHCSQSSIMSLHSCGCRLPHGSSCTHASQHARLILSWWS